MPDLDVGLLKSQVAGAREQGYSDQDIEKFLVDSKVSADVISQVFEPTAVEQPAVEQPVVEQPVVDQPVVDQPVVDQPVVEQPVVEQPVVEQPVVEQPVDQSTEPKDEDYIPMSWYYGEDSYIQDNEEREVRDLAGSYRNIQTKYSTLAKDFAGLLGSDDLSMSARRDITSMNNDIAERLQKKGYNTFTDKTTGDLMLKNKDGVDIHIDSGMLESMLKSKFEAAGDVFGYSAGTAIAVALGSTPPLAALPEEIFTVPTFGKIGSSVFAAGGRGLDMLINAYKVNEDLESSWYAKQMFDAALIGPVINAVGRPVVGALKKGGKHIMKAYDYVMKSNPDGAAQYLMNYLRITRDQALDIVKGWEKKVGTQAGLTESEKIVSAVTSTKQGAAPFVEQAAQLQPKVSSSVSLDLNKRSSEMKEAISKAGTTDVRRIGKVVQEDLADYRTKVSDLYGAVRDNAAKIIDKTDFRFNMRELALKPLADKIQAKLVDPVKKQTFANKLEAINFLSAPRNFSGLVDLRQELNFLRGKKGNLRHNDYVAMSKIINKVDSRIGEAVSKYLPKTKTAGTDVLTGKQWSRQFREAKSAYRDMKTMEKNALYKLVTNRDAAKDTSKYMSRYIDTANDTIPEVLGSVPAKSRANAELGLFDYLFEKKTRGTSRGNKATDWADLADSLEYVPFASKKTKELTKAVQNIAEVFESDEILRTSSRGLSSPKAGSNISPTPVGMARQELASSTFRWIKRLIPNESGRATALMYNTARLLKNPLDTGTVKRVLDNIPQESVSQAKTVIERIQEATARANLRRPKSTEEPVSHYGFKMTKKQNLEYTNGMLGKGVYLTEDVPKTAIESGYNVLKYDLTNSRLVTDDVIKKMTGGNLGVKNLGKNEALVDHLKDAGFTGVYDNGRVMLFDKPSRADITGTLASKKKLPTPSTQELADMFYKENLNKRMKRIEKRLNRAVNDIEKD